MTAVEKLITTAKSEVGYLEKKTNNLLDSKTANAGMNNYTKYARDLDKLGVYNTAKNGYSWCDVFVDWCLIKTFGLMNAMTMTHQPLGKDGASCTNSAKYYKDAGKFYINNPKVGDQIFFTNDNGKTYCHTGLVTAIKNGKVYTIEGNTSSKVGVVANGGCVAEKSYSLTYNKIGGYGRPNYALVEEEDDEDMNVERFEELWQEMRKELQDNDAAQWSKSARDWSIASGLINGSGTTASGEPNYMWNDFLTREQMAVLLYRFAQLMGKA
jgi:hypothetical protein